jgi:hypothetical protein
MAIETKPEKKPETEKPTPLQFRDNPEVKKKIEAHKAANPDDHVYYTRLVNESPERAIDTLIYRDVQRHENDMRLIEKQLPQAMKFYNSQTPEGRARIDRDLQDVKPYYRDKAFVSAALREKDRQARKEFATPVAAPNGVTPTADASKVVPMPTTGPSKPPKVAV